MNDLIGAVDLSGKKVTFVLGDGTKEIINKSEVMNNKGSAKLADFVLEALSEHGYSICDVGKWTVGAGPGSFTGMRLVAALVSGWSFGKAIKTRCVPTAIAIASEIEAKKDEKVAVVFDGRNQEVLIFETVFNGKEMVPGTVKDVYNKESISAEFEKKRFNHYITSLENQVAVAKVVGEDRMKQVKVIENFNANYLIRAEYQDYDDNLDDLVYIRPAVFS